MGHVAIIGAGVAGLTAAAELLAAGHRVTIVDRAEGLGPAQCSWWAGGMLAPWCERESAEQEVVDWGAAAADWWEAHTPLTRAGTLVVAPARDRAELSRFARRTTNFTEVDEAGIATLEPDLAGRFRHGLFFAEEAHLDPRKALASLTEHLTNAGAQLHFGSQDVPPADLTLDCRGMAAADCLTDLRGVKGEMALIRTREISLSRPVRLLHPRHPIYLVPRGEGVYMLGATMIESADRSRVTLRSMLELLGAAYALHPAFAEAEILETGTDIRPAFPDNLPRVTPIEGGFAINGLYRHGFLLSPAMAKRAATAVTRALSEAA
ncbi:MAG: FAD-dependent oxidoreductase [Pseudomonadota bacterium]